MLLYRGNTGGLIVEPPVMAKYRPALRTNYIQPFIVLNILGKLVSLVVMIFHSKRRLCPPESLGKVFTEATVKIES